MAHKMSKFRSKFLKGQNFASIEEFKLYNILDIQKF